VSGEVFAQHHEVKQHVANQPKQGSFCLRPAAVLFLLVVFLFTLRHSQLIVVQAIQVFFTLLPIPKATRTTAIRTNMKPSDLYQTGDRSQMHTFGS
jgi:hypothetical protein